MKRLLSKNLSKRIKPSDIPKHSFFKDLDFEKIEKMNYTAPIIPNIVRYFIIKRKMTWIQLILIQFF